MLLYSENNSTKDQDNNTIYNLEIDKIFILHFLLYSATFLTLTAFEVKTETSVTFAYYEKIQIVGNGFLTEFCVIMRFAA